MTRDVRLGTWTVRTIANPGVLGSILDRLARLGPDTPRRWGSLTPGEMLCHLGDAQDWALGRREIPGPPPRGKPSVVVKWYALRVPLPWPKGVATRRGVNPRKEGTRPVVFESDRARVVDGLRGLAAAPAGSFPATHFMFGEMTRRDWQRWAFKHVDHHLRQFGL